MYLTGLDNVEENNNAVDAVDGRILINNSIHRIIADRNDINHFFEGGQDFRTAQNRAYLPQGYQLGWDSYIALRHTDGLLRIEQIYNLTENAVFADITGNLRNAVCETAVTRAVDFCTFIYVHKGDMHYMFHLDEYDIARAELLSGKLREICGGKALISLIKGQEKYINCFAGTGIATQVIVRYLNNFDTLPDADKKPFADCPDQINVYGHLEIGLHIKNKEIMLFGDVSDRWRGDYQVPYYRFYGIGEMHYAIDLLRRDMP